MTRIPFVHLICVAHFVTTSLCFCAASPEESSERQAQFVLRHGEHVLCLIYSTDGRQLASGSWDNTISLWDSQTGRQLHVLRGHDKYVEDLSYSPDDRQLASGSRDNTVRIWDPQNGRQLYKFGEYEELVFYVSYSPDGRQLASGFGDGTVRIWDPHNGRQLRILEGNIIAYNLTYSPDGRQLALRSDKTVRIWDPQSGRQLHILKEHEDDVCCFSYSPDGRQLASGGYGNTGCIWDPRSGRKLHIIKIRGNAIYCVSYSPNGMQLAFLSEHTVCICDPQSGSQQRMLNRDNFRTRCLCYSPDGEQLAACSDGRKLASGFHEGLICIWDPHTGRQLQILRGHERSISCLRYSPDGRQLASGSDDGTVCIWNIAKPSQGQDSMAFLERVIANAKQNRKTFIEEGSVQSRLFMGLPISIRERVQEHIVIVPGNWQCPICFEGRGDKPVAATRCKHLFHEECLARWQSGGNTTCPYCRGPIN